MKLPEVDDAFAKKSGPFNTAKELREDIARELTAQQDRQAVDQLKGRSTRRAGWQEQGAGAGCADNRRSTGVVGA